MTLYTPIYNPSADRLDRLAEEAGASALAVALVNPEWDGESWIREPVLPAGDIDYTPALTPDAQAARDRLYTISNPAEYLRTLPFAAAGQMREDLGAIAGLLDAAWWSARMRLLLPLYGVMWHPELGTNWARGALASTQQALNEIARYAEQVLDADSVWYGVLQVEPDLREPLRLRLITELRLLVE